MVLSTESQAEQYNVAHYNERFKMPNIAKAGGLYSEILKKISKFALFKCHEQFVIFQTANKSGICMAPCKNSFTSQYGIPCAHRLSQIVQNGGFLTVHDFHSQWHICNANDSRDSINGMLNTFDDFSKYNTLANPLNDCESSSEQLENDVTSPISVLNSDDSNAVVFLKQPDVKINDLSEKLAADRFTNLRSPKRTITKGRPKGAKSNSAKSRVPVSSTKRDKSLFEHVENKLDKRDKLVNGNSTYRCIKFLFILIC